MAANQDIDLTVADSDGDTAISLATECGHAEILALQKIDTTSNLGIPLIQAARDGHHGIVKILCTANPPADLEITDGSGNTALIIAARFGHCEIVKLLVSKGVGIHKVNHGGNTALILACRYGNTAAVKMLLRARASRDIKRRCGLSSLQIAERECHDEVVGLFDVPIHLADQQGHHGVAGFVDVPMHMTDRDDHHEHAGSFYVFLESLHWSNHWGLNGDNGF